MSYQSPHSVFVFEDCKFDASTSMAEFHYSFDGVRHFCERLQFKNRINAYNTVAFERALLLAYILGGISYYKTFPTKQIDTSKFLLSNTQATFFSNVYLHGLSQYIFENNLASSDIGSFHADASAAKKPVPYYEQGALVLQSGGKDSLLLAELLTEQNVLFSPWYMSSSSGNPGVIEKVGLKPLRTVHRQLDNEALATASRDGGLNGHVPVTYITLAYALLDALLHGENTILAAIGREGEEPHAQIGDYPILHQWSKTWTAEQQFVRYIAEHVSTDIRVGSPLRGFSELRIAELFSKHAWQKYGHQFSSCNIGNYQQGQDNTELTWCGHCPKCANSFLLFAPFIDPVELKDVFGSNLFADSGQTATFKGLLGIDDIIKPFECVGEIAELRMAYHMALRVFPRANYELPFAVPEAQYDYEMISAAQPWAKEMLQ